MLHGRSLRSLITEGVTQVAVRPRGISTRSPPFCSQGLDMLLSSGSATGVATAAARAVVFMSRVGSRVSRSQRTVQSQNTSPTWGTVSSRRMQWHPVRAVRVDDGFGRVH